MSILDLFRTKFENPIIRYDNLSNSVNEESELFKLFEDLKSVALRIEGSFHHSTAVTTVDNDANSACLLQYNKFCSQIEDSLIIWGKSQDVNTANKSVNIYNITKDFSEGFSTRYGELFASKVSIIVGKDLPVIQANPSKLIRLIDSFARSSILHNPESILEIIISKTNNFNLNGNNICFKIEFKNIGFAVDNKKVHNLTQELSVNNIRNAIHLLGIEYCAAVKTAFDLNSTIQIKANSDKSTSVELNVPFDLAKSTNYPVLLCPKNFYLYSHSSDIKKVLLNMAKYENQSITLVNSLDKAPDEESFVIDLSSSPKNLIEEVAKVKNPEKAVIILARYDLDTMRALTKMGFTYFISLPLVSSQLFYCLQGALFVRYKPHQEILANKPKKKLRVLIVDDVMTARIVLRDYFEFQGHEVIEAADGHEFVNKIELGGKFDIVFCDQTMPCMDGITATKIVREYEKSNGSNTPIILITAYDSLDQDDSQKLFNRMLTKPISLNKVEEAINDFAIENYFNQKINPNRKQTLSTEIIDLEDLRERCSGREKTMIKVLDSFIDSCKSQASQLDLEEIYSNSEKLKKIIHTLKGLMRDAGAKHSSEIIKEYEDKLLNLNSLEREDLNKIKDLVIETSISAEKTKTSLIGGSNI